MTNDYVTPEVIEIGEAQALIRGSKPDPSLEESGEVSFPDSSLDD